MGIAITKVTDANTTFASGHQLGQAFKVIMKRYLITGFKVWLQSLIFRKDECVLALTEKF